MRRAPGLAVLFTVIAVGMGMPALYRWKVGDLRRTRERILSEAPSAPEKRVELWFSHLQPRLLEVLHKCRFSSDKPYLVSHMVAPAREGVPPEIWGVPEEAIDPSQVVLDGMVVRVILPAPRLLERDVLVGDNALGVPVYPAEAPPEDPGALLRERLEFVFEKFMRALERDIPGSYVSIEIGGVVPDPPPGAAGGAATDPVSTDPVSTGRD